MNKSLKNLLGELIQLELAGKSLIHGTAIDLGSDVIVVFNGKGYVYIPLIHIKNIKMISKNELDFEMEKPKELPEISLDQNFSLRKALTAAKGMFLEIGVTNKDTLHGYITSIMNNYFVFHSPVYKTMYITLNHLKWLSPYTDNKKPYGLHSQVPQTQISNLSLARSFEVQVEKLTGELVVFNVGETNALMGKINHVEENIIEFQTAREEPYFLNMYHIKTVHKV